MCERVVVGVVGVISWVDGFVRNPKLRELSFRQRGLVREASIDLEGTFDKLFAEGRIEEAAWLVENLEKFERPRDS